MNPIERFGQYATAFEEFFASNDPSVLEPYFTEDAVYEVVGGELFAGSHQGRPAVLAHLASSLDAFDRRFDSRRLELLEGPALREGAVWLRWRASYKSPGLPELVIDGEETATFEGDRIRRLEDVFPPQMSPLLQHWLDHYGQELPAPAR